MIEEILKTETISKADIKSFSDSVILKNEQGEIDPLRTYIKAKAMETVIKNVVTGLQGSALTEAAKYEGKTFETMGAEITLKSTGDTPDYEADETYKSLKENLKSREEQLKTAFRAKGEYIEDGELIPRVPVKTYGKDTLSISFK